MSLSEELHEAIVGVGKNVYTIPSPHRGIKTIDDLLLMTDRDFSRARKMILSKYKKGEKPLYYGIKNFSPSFPYEKDKERKEFLVKRYWDRIPSLSREVQSVIDSFEKSSRKEKKSGGFRHEVQVFEPCERCGREPSYTTVRGHLCKRCK